MAHLVLVYYTNVSVTRQRNMPFAPHIARFNFHWIIKHSLLVLVLVFCKRSAQLGTFTLDLAAVKLYDRDGDDEESGGVAGNSIVKSDNTRAQPVSTSRRRDT